VVRTSSGNRSGRQGGADGAGLGQHGELVVRKLLDRAAGGPLGGGVGEEADDVQHRLHRRPGARVEPAVQALGGEDVGLTERSVGAVAAVEPLVAEGRDLDPAAGARIGCAEVQGAAAVGVPEHGGPRGLEGDGVGADAREDQLGVVHRSLPPTSCPHLGRK
jgi:hypothetical protein